MNELDVSLDRDASPAEVDSVEAAFQKAGLPAQVSASYGAKGDTDGLSRGAVGQRLVNTAPASSCD